MPTPLARRLAAQIAETGPLTVAQYMTACLHDPQHGYYAAEAGRRAVLGKDGDFLTAPLVSQAFGELLGLWAAAAWEQLGRPAPVRLVEVGGGDGTLMADALRALRAAAPAFAAAAEVVMVEPSPALTAVQQARLGDPARWATSLEAVGADAPVLLLANEVLDCLPARQFVRTARGWAERVVGVDAAGALAFGLAPAAPPPGVTAAVGELVEVSGAQAAFGAAVGDLLARAGGAALLIDYGRAEPGPGDTLQALRGHRKEPPLASPGEADLTVWADFPAVAAAARAAGAAAAPLLSQGELLGRLGLPQRLSALAAARPDQAPVLQRQLDRLTAPAQMGTLFKALCLYRPGDPPPPAFDPDPASNPSAA